MLPDGVIPPVLTPFTVDQEVDIEAFVKLLERLIAGSVHALFVAGTAGFGSIMTQSQYEMVVETALTTCSNRIPLIVGVLESSTNRAVEKLRFLEKAGVSTAVVVTPFYLRAQNESQLMRHFGILRESTSMELVVYNLPGCTGTEIPVGIIRDMAEKGWISACKDSSNNDTYFQALCEQTRHTKIKVYQGMRPDFAHLAKLGASGCVPVPGNVYPELFVNAWENRKADSQLVDLQIQCDEMWNKLVTNTDFFSGSMKLLASQGIGTGTLPEPFEKK